MNSQGNGAWANEGERDAGSTRQLCADGGLACGGAGSDSMVAVVTGGDEVWAFDASASGQSATVDVAGHCHGGSAMTFSAAIGGGSGGPLCSISDEVGWCVSGQHHLGTTGGNGGTSDCGNLDTDNWAISAAQLNGSGPVVCVGERSGCLR